MGLNFEALLTLFINACVTGAGTGLGVWLVGNQIVRRIDNKKKPKDTKD